MTRKYTVVVNYEGQHSLWPATREPPAGWQQVSSALSQDECLAYIGQAWTDMRPRSLVRVIEEQAPPR